MKIFTFDTVVIGTGAAGYNAACRLKSFGKKRCYCNRRRELRNLKKYR